MTEFPIRCPICGLALDIQPRFDVPDGVPTGVMYRGARIMEGTVACPVRSCRGSVEILDGDAAGPPPSSS